MHLQFAVNRHNKLTVKHSLCNAHHLEFFTNYERSPELKVCVTIPIRNEEAHIVDTLTAFSTQIDLNGTPINSELFEILILANNCTDNTVDLVKDFQRIYPNLRIHLVEVSLLPHQSNIGYARRLLFDAAYKRLNDIEGSIIMTTDGDSTVNNDWIVQNLAEIRLGADAVGGRILLHVDELKNLDSFTQSLHLKDDSYQILAAELESILDSSIHDPFPRHHQHFNGSFAVTTACYAKAGGMPHVANLEDCAFFESLQKVDAKLRHSQNVQVRTSARCIGRTEVGLSYQLNVWRNLGMGGGEFLVESCASLVARFTLKSVLRELWSEYKRSRYLNYFAIKQLSMALLVSADVILEAFKNSVYFGEFYQHISFLQNNKWRKIYPFVTLDDAIINLQKAIKHHSAQHFSQTSIL